MWKQCLASWAMALGLTAQQPELSTVGRFVGTDGEPVAGAVVTFATSSPIAYDAFGPPTLVTAITDEQGRFHASLRTGCAYSVYAVEDHERGEAARSDVHEGVVAGSVIELRVVERRRRQRITIDEFAQLGQGPFWLLVRSDARHGPVLRLPIDASGVALLPPLPAGRGAARIVDAEDRVRVGWMGMQGEYAAFRAPERIGFVIRDPDGEPVAGARVQMLSGDVIGRGREPFRRVRHWPCRLSSAPCDAQGQTAMDLFEHEQPFVVAVPGMGAALAYRSAGKLVTTGSIDDGRIVLTLQPSGQLTGRLRRGAQAVAGRRLAVDGRVDIQEQWGARHSFPIAATAATDADGSFAFADLPLLPGSYRLAVQTAADEPVIVLRDRSREAIAAADLRVDLDLAALPVCTFQVRDQAAGPPAAARVVLWSAPDAEPVVLVADRAGRVSACLEPGEWFVLATDGAGVGSQVLAVVGGSGEQRVALDLEALAICRGQLQQADGSPYAHIHFNLHSSQGSVDRPATPAERWLRDLGLSINQSLISGSRTGADGRFEIRYLPIDGLQLSGSFSDLASLTLATGHDLEVRARR